MKFIVKSESKITQGYCYTCADQHFNDCKTQSSQSCKGFKCPEQRY